MSLLISLLVAIPSTSYGARGEFDDRNSVRERKKQKKKRFRIGDKKKNNKTDQPIASTSEQLIAEGEEEPYDLELDMETQVNHSIGRLCLWILSILTSHPKAASEFMSSEGLPTVVELLKSRDQVAYAANLFVRFYNSSSSFFLFPSFSPSLVFFFRTFVLSSFRFFVLSSISFFRPLVLSSSFRPCVLVFLRSSICFPTVSICRSSFVFVSLRKSMRCVYAYWCLLSIGYVRFVNSLDRLGRRSCSGEVPISSVRAISFLRA